MRIPWLGFKFFLPILGACLAAAAGSASLWILFHSPLAHPSAWRTALPLVGALLVCVAVSIIGAVWTTSELLRPVVRLTQALRAAAHEHYQVTLPQEGASHVRELSQHLNAMIQDLRTGAGALSHKVEELAGVFEVSQTVASSLDLEVVLKLIASKACHVIRGEVCTLSLADRETGMLTPRAAVGVPLDLLRQNPTHMAGGVAKAVLNQDSPQIFPVLEGPEYHLFDPHKRDRLRSLLLVPLRAKGRSIGLLSCYSLRAAHDFQEADFRILALFTNQAASAIENATLYQEIKDHYLKTVYALARALEFKDRYTRGHTERCKTYALAMAREMHLPEEKLAVVEHVAVLHDIGKIGTPDEILNKPGPLTPHEFEVIKQHTTAGARIIAPIPGMEEVARAIRAHQEFYDGRGYPDGLAGEAIPLPARIIAVADAFDAMTSDRVYRKALPLEQAVRELQKHAGTQFDPLCVNVLLRLIERKAVIVRSGSSGREVTEGV